MLEWYGVGILLSSDYNTYYTNTILQYIGVLLFTANEILFNQQQLEHGNQHKLCATVHSVVLLPF